MELKKDGVLFINVIFRIVSLIAFVSDHEMPVLTVRNAILNWNGPLTERVVLILANGIRDDFLEAEATPFLRRIANGSGTLAKATVEEMVSVDGSLRSVLTGIPWHGALLAWNRPEKYKTILDYASCKCVVGTLPVTADVRCRESGQNHTEVFDKFREMTPKDCLYVLSFEFGGTTGREYVQMLRELDEEVRNATERWTDTTWVLTSSRGWSVWNRTDGGVDVPVLAWGKGILPTEDTRTIRLMDVTALVSTLLGQSFPGGALSQVPTYLLSASADAKFYMTLYNFEHLEKTLGNVDKGDEFEVRNLNGIIDEGNTLSLKQSIDNFLEMVHELRMTRMKVFTIIAVVCFGFWSVVFLVTVVRGSLLVDVASSIVVVNVIAVVCVIVYLKPDVLHVAVMVLLTPITVLSLSDVVKAFYAEGYRLFLLSLGVSVVTTIFTVVGNLVTIILLMTAIGLWPAWSRVVVIMNRKILLSWFASAGVLVTLLFYDVIGRDPTPGVTILSSVLHVALFHFAYQSFKRRVDRQSWVTTVAVLSSTYHVYFCHLWGFTTSTCFLSWCFLLYGLFATFPIRGTILERLLKFHLVLLIPMQLLSNRHESLFHVALAIHMFSWVFAEHASHKSVLLYNPSIFTLELPAPEFTSESLQAKHYRQVFFFMAYAHVSFFAAGNLPTVYTYDYAILKPFCNICPLLLIPLKLILPFASVVYTFLTLNYTQRADPAMPMILSIVFSDVISACFLTHTYILTDTVTVNASHYIIFQSAIASITALYLVQRCVSRRNFTVRAPQPVVTLITMSLYNAGERDLDVIVRAGLNYTVNDGVSGVSPGRRGRAACGPNGHINNTNAGV